LWLASEMPTRWGVANRLVALARTPLPGNVVNEKVMIGHSSVTSRTDRRKGRYIRAMSEQALKVKNEAIPERAQGLYYAKGSFSEALVYRDDEALYFEHRGEDAGTVRLSFGMLETLKTVIKEEQEEARVNSLQ
jgi:hypothetical protein